MIEDFRLKIEYLRYSSDLKKSVERSDIHKYSIYDLQFSILHAP